jgi:hypothetical protein
MHHHPDMAVHILLEAEVVDYLIIYGWLDEQDSHDPIEVGKAVHDFLEVQVCERRLYSDH